MCKHEPDFRSKCHFVYQSAASWDKLCPKVHGGRTAATRARKSDCGNLLLGVPTEGKTSLMDQILNSLREFGTCAALRDTRLQKLLSRKALVHDSEHLIEQVV